MAVTVAVVAATHNLAITAKYATRSKTVEIIGLNEHSVTMRRRPTGELAANH
jgi:SulP family sulfate permease